MRKSIVVFSVERKERSEQINMATHYHAVCRLRDYNVKATQCLGFYDGVGERALIVPFGDLLVALALALENDQECVMVVNDLGEVCLMNPLGKVIEKLEGSFHETSEKDAKEHIGWTYDVENDRYYTVS